MSDCEKFEPIRFPIEKNVDVNIARYGNLVNVYYNIDGEELNLSLIPIDAVKFADLLRLVADEIMDEKRNS